MKQFSQKANKSEKCKYRKVEKMCERQSLETSDNFFSVDLYPVHMSNMFSCTVWMFTELYILYVLTFLI